MYNSAKIKECLAGIVGISQVYGTQYPTLDPKLTTGFMFDLHEVHPLIEMENLVSSYRSAKQLGYLQWDITKTYSAKTRVLKVSTAYESLTDNNTGNDPAIDTDNWKVIDVLSEQLLLSIDSSIDKLVQSVFIQKKINSLVKTIVDDFRLYDGRGDMTNKNANVGRFVGFKMMLHQGQDLVVNLPRISFQFDTECPDLKLYLYNTSQSEFVKVIPINYNQRGVVKWFDLNDENAISLGAFADGDYIIGYYEEDLAPGAQSIKKETNLVDPKLCGSCNGADYKLFATRSNYLDLQPFYVDNANLAGTDLWNEAHEVYVEKNNFGMNIQFSVNCDLSDFICRNKIVFAEALSLQAAADILKHMQFSSLDNQQLLKLKSNINYALNGSKENYNIGLYKELSKAIDALDFDLSNLNSICLPCNERPQLGRRVM
ncbi:hypothetical protein [Pedobacter zeae]|uniref:Uncharacterized protein n=1 Tax=Pedobacter zeae TaxID=1737356 RepID=A0A7W6K9M2_9SPHI|nr:hypothetical protein [Pedobacter zeae]MBB4107743.1 hypothetical protein [Pedobacter zeae]GGG97330.1 hypothetical protein GCM10007422_09110 [Pedobacter zeae]